MRKLSFKETVSISILFLIVLLATLAMRPVYSGVNQRLSLQARGLCQFFEEKYGISISYESLSPSIITGLRIKNIVLKEKYDESTLVEIQKTVVRYSILDFLKGKKLSSIKDVEIDGFILLFDKNDDGKLMNQLMSFVESKKKHGKKQSDEKKTDTTEKKQFSIENLEDSLGNLPFNVFVRNVHLKYSDGKKYVDAFFKKITIDFLEQNGHLTVKTVGGMKSNLFGKTVSCSFSADGIIPESISGSSIVFRITDADVDKLLLRHFNFLMIYEGKTISFKSFQNNYPFDFAAFYDIEKKEASVDFQTKELKPGTIIVLGKNDRGLSKIKNLRISSKSNARINLDSKQFSYSSNGNLDIPGKIFHGGINLDFSLWGNNREIQVEKLAAKGPNIDVDFNGSWEFQNLCLDGFLSANSIVLKNGRRFSTEFYFVKAEKGFDAFAPQFFLDEKALTGLQLSLTPSSEGFYYNFEFSDYGDMLSDTAGVVRMNGSFEQKKKNLEFDLMLEQISVGSLAQTASSFMPKGKQLPSKSLEKYLINGDIFVSSNLNLDSTRIYAPYVIVANTQKENQMASIEFSGNRHNIEITQIKLISGDKLISAKGDVNLSGDGEFSFDLSADSGYFPYNFTGNYMPGIMSIVGDYGFACEIRTGIPSGISGSLYSESFPVVLGDSKFAFSTDCSFIYDAESGIDARINRFEGSEIGMKYSFNPKFLISGLVSKYGFFIENLVYSDRFSTLEGNGSLKVNVEGKTLSSVLLNLDAKNPFSTEEIEITAELSNSDRLPVSLQTVLENFNFNAQISVSNFGLNRFLKELSENNSVTAIVSAYGNIKNPSVGLEISSLNVMSKGTLAQISTVAYIDERNLSVEKLNLQYGSSTVKNMTGSFNLNDFTGNAKAEFSSVVAKQSVIVPMEIFVSNTVVEQGSLIPSEFIANLRCRNVSGTLFTKTFPLDITVIHSKNSTSVFTGDQQGIHGTIDSEKFIDFSIAKGKPVNFKLAGQILEDQLALSLSDVNANLQELFSYINISKLKIFQGILTGNVGITGLQSDPDFNGEMLLSGGVFSLPGIVPSHIVLPQETRFEIEHNKIELKQIMGYVKKNHPIFCSVRIFFERWKFDYLDTEIFTPKDSYIPGYFVIRLAKFIGDVALNLKLHLEDGFLDITGDVGLKNTEISVNTKEIPNAPPKRKIMYRSDININFGRRVTFTVDPLIRAVLIPGTGFVFNYDTSERSLRLDGELKLRSGDISYLSRNFYLKNGLIKFNKKDVGFNPVISVQAETRERDENGNEVRIVLSANNQPFDNFNPRFSSIPARSETEIMTMLGQIAVGDSDNVAGLLFATGDYAIQATIGRSIENKLRDFLNFDILSVRTNVLQNALNYNFNKRQNGEDSYRISNFFDNSTVYFGKYIGRSLYVDSLMHWSYDETKIDDEYTLGGLQFKPEIGFEIESPFVNIRWNMAPSLSGLRTANFVDSTSVTLSWKFSF